MRECYIKYVDLLVCFYIGYAVQLRNSSKIYVVLFPWGFGGVTPEKVLILCGCNCALFFLEGL